MEDKVYNAIIASDVLEAKKLVADCLDFIKENFENVSYEELQDIKLVLCELLYNAVIHGNNKDENKTIKILVFFFI